MENLNGYSVEELVEIRNEVSETIKAKRAEARENAKAVKAERDAEMRGKVNENDSVTFMFNKKETEGKIVRTSEKSVTVEFELNGETVTRYRKYSDIVEVL
ncbi:hypothetical protein CL614_00385 [archaeon]|nr:hypothetical protein [archaeon]